VCEVEGGFQIFMIAYKRLCKRSWFAVGKIAKAVEYVWPSRQPGTAAIEYTTPDHLGTPRVITDQNGAVWAGTITSRSGRR